MVSTFLLAIGAGVSLLGTWVRVTPDLSRKHRRWSYQLYPFTRDLIDKRTEIKKSEKGVSFTIENNRIRREAIDYIDAKDIREPPSEPPIAVKNKGANIQLEFSDRDPEQYMLGYGGQKGLVELHTMGMERACRNTGIGIVIVGGFVTITGILLGFA